MSYSLDCTVIVVSYNNSDVIGECLVRVAQAKAHCEQKLGNSVQCIVLDNKSTDGSQALIREQYPFVQLVELDQNYGPAVANNRGMALATTPYMLLINSDTYLEEDTLTKIFQYIQAGHRVDVVCVRLWFGDGRFQPFGGSVPTPFRTIRWSLLMERIPFFKNYIKPIYQYNKKFYTKEQCFGWIATSFFFLHRRVYEATRGLDEKMFIHMEDVEWCKRIIDHGFTIKYLPRVSSIHLGGKSTKKFSSLKLLTQHVSGMKYFHLKHYPRYWFMVRTALKVGMVLRCLIYFAADNVEQAQAYLEILRMF
jgi:GT2 family glycosyltransferase